LEFSFGPMARRVTYIGLKIPPLPFGPLSVRDFHLEVPAASGQGWVQASPRPMMTLDTDEMQDFCIHPPLETKSVRLVCTRNAAAACSEGGSGAAADCIGLFQVAFA